MTNDNHHIFIIDDERKVCNVLCESLMQYEINATCFTRVEDCLKELESHRCDLCASIMKKLNTENAVDLVKQAALICLNEFSHNHTIDNILT